MGTTHETESYTAPGAPLVSGSALSSWGTGTASQEKAESPPLRIMLPHQVQAQSLGNGRLGGDNDNDNDNDLTLSTWHEPTTTGWLDPFLPFSSVQNDLPSLPLPLAQPNSMNPTDLSFATPAFEHTFPTDRFTPFTPLANRLQHTTLSPLFGDFTTSPSSFAAPLQLPSGQLRAGDERSDLPGPVRTFQPGSIQSPLPFGQRKSNTMTSGTAPSITSASPATPSSGVMIYPYPSPRGLVINRHGAVIRRPTVPLSPLSQTAHIRHPHPHHHPQPLSHPRQHPQTTYHPFRSDNGGGGGAGKRLHPSPPSPGLDVGHGRTDDSRDGAQKPPRFRPTKEQLEILIAAYDENKNPDGATREALARALGPEVKPKTLQIWFQNRRSKSRAKERGEQTGPKALSLKYGQFGRLSGEGRRAGGAVDVEALKGLTRDDDPALLIVPINVLSISTWNRFLTPGSGYTAPDLGCAIRLPSDSTPSPISPDYATAGLRSGSQAYVALYVVHRADTFRILIPLDRCATTGGDILRNAGSGSAVLSVHAAANHSMPSSNVAVRLELRPGGAEFASWAENEGEWRPTGDFTGGLASRGGRFEITGDREIVLPAFSGVQQYLGGGNDTLTAGPLSAVEPSTPFPTNWRFPPASASASTAASALTSAATSVSSSSGAPLWTPAVSGVVTYPASLATIPLSLSSAPLSAAAAVPMASSLSLDFPMPRPGMRIGAGQAHSHHHHQRQRSSSAPLFPAPAPAEGVGNGNRLVPVPGRDDAEGMFFQAQSDLSAAATESPAESTQIELPPASSALGTGYGDWPSSGFDTPWASTSALGWGHLPETLLGNKSAEVFWRVSAFDVGEGVGGVDGDFDMDGEDFDVNADPGMGGQLGKDLIGLNGDDAGAGEVLGGSGALESAEGAVGVQGG